MEKYKNVISGEVQTRNNWINEIDSQGWHISDWGIEYDTAEEYFEDAVNIGNLVRL